MRPISKDPHWKDNFKNAGLSSEKCRESMPIFVNVNIYVFKSCAAIYDDFRNSPESAAHDLDTYIFTFTKIVMLSLQFSKMRPAFLKAVFQCESFDVGLIRVRESPKVRLMVLSRLIHLFCTYLTHCAVRGSGNFSTA